MEETPHNNFKEDKKMSELNLNNIVEEASKVAAKPAEIITVAPDTKHPFLKGVATGAGGTLVLGGLVYGGKKLIDHIRGKKEEKKEEKKTDDDKKEEKKEEDKKESK